jgi:hypothetical protein
VPGNPHQFRVGVAIGDQMVDLTAAHASGIFMEAGPLAQAAAQAC